MKNTLWLSNLGLGLALSLVFIARPAAAESFDALRITLPDSVAVGAATLPAGEYLIRDVRDDGSASVVEIRSTQGGPGVLALVMRITLSDGALDQTRVVLHRTESKLQLQQIWLKGHTYGYELLSAGQ